MKQTEENVDQLKVDVIELHDKPIKRWETVIAALISTLIGLGIGLLFK
jgi:hypothetical protein